MNPHLNIFNNYREYELPIENNLTRSFILTLKNEPQLLRDFLYLVSGRLDWDEIFVSIQNKNIDVSGFENIIGLAVTSKAISSIEIDTIDAHGVDNPTPDFLIYNSKTLIIGEVKKHSENPIAQLKNQVKYLIDSRSDKDTVPQSAIKSMSWTEILSHLIIPFETYNSKQNIRTVWASEFKEYISIHYGDWLPTPTFDKISFSLDSDSIQNQFIEKRLFDIQSLTKFGTPQYWIGGRKTLPLGWVWATEALVKPWKIDNNDYICVTIWPANTKAQGYHIFNKNLDWVYKSKLKTETQEFILENIVCIKFSHVMGKFIGDIRFDDEYVSMGKAFLTWDNFDELCGMWYRSDWKELSSFLNANFLDKFDWRKEINWDSHFENSGRNFVFISLGLESNIYIPFTVFQELDKADPTGKKCADLIEDTIEKFRILVESST